jgi:N utilization substance protein A
MATKKKTKKKQPKSKRTSGKKLTPMKNAVEKKLAKKRVTLKKKLAKKNSAPKKVVAKTKAGGKKTTGGKTGGALKKQVQGKSQSVDTVAFALERLGARPGEQSGDLQGLSNVQRADSESVDELLEQGNAFEAEAVKGVEDAGDSDEGEVRTHEVPQDDVPGEYLAKE